MIGWFFFLSCSTEIKVHDTSSSPSLVLTENEQVSTETFLPPPTSGTSTEIVQQRDRRRMNLLQLDSAIEYVTGHNYPAFWEAKASLGQPDYDQIIKEVREPELFFHNFLQDAAHLNCDLLLNEEETLNPQERRFLVHLDVGETEEALVKTNIAYLLLRFHGHRYQVEHPQIEHWYTLFTEIQNHTDDAQTTWKAMCVALIRHPDFYSY